MALDGITVAVLVRELRESVLGAKIDKIYQPQKDTITLTLRSHKGSYKLLLSANASNPRTHLTKASFLNPAAAPMFCMLLRKYLGGGKVVDIVQPEVERVIDFSVKVSTELGDLSVYHLIAEIMGRHSNIILTDAGCTIIDSIKRIDISVSSRRQVLPSLSYELPPSQGKINPFEVKEQKIADLLSAANNRQKIDRFIVDTFAGISPVVAREICYRALGTADIYADSLLPEMRQKLGKELFFLFCSVREGASNPCVVYDKATGKPLDFSVTTINQYKDAARLESFATVNEAADRFFSERDALERKNRKTDQITRIVNSHIDRLTKKLALLNSTLDEAKNKDLYKQYADLLTANLYRLRDESKSAQVEDFYSGGQSTVVIPLDPSLSPQANAQKYYKKYRKAKTAETEAARQIELAQQELNYLKSILQNCLLAATEQDLSDIESELAAGGYAPAKSGGKNKKQPEKSKPLHFISSDGFDIYCGKNNLQNDYLTLRFAKASDLWFHAKMIPGSHTIVRLGTNKSVPERTIKEAAVLAAFYSSARDGYNVPIDYTQIKNVKKPSKAKPGMVVYDNYNTIYVVPDASLAEKLRAPEK